MNTSYLTELGVGGAVAGIIGLFALQVIKLILAERERKRRPAPNAEAAMGGPHVACQYELKQGMVRLSESMAKVDANIANIRDDLAGINDDLKTVWRKFDGFGERITRLEARTNGAERREDKRS